MAITQAVIIAGGLGTRLRPLTDKVPKAMVPILGKPLTEHLLGLLKSFGVKEAWLAIGYRADQIKKYFGDGRKLGITLHYLVEQEPLGTGGWMHVIDRDALHDNFLVLNGDNLFDLDFQHWIAFHEERQAVATIALTEVKDASSSGAVQLDHGKIIAFVEKPKKGEEPGNWVSSGYYLFNKKIFSYLPKQEKIMLENDVFPRLAKKGLLYGYVDKGLWFDTGTFERLKEVEARWKKA